MKNTSKILALVLVLMTVLMSLSVLNVSAANITGGVELYVKPNSNWLQKGDNADPWFAAYFYNGSVNKWAAAEPVGDGIYKVTAPAGTWTNVIFCRMNGTKKGTLDWSAKYNQTADLTFNGSANLYTVKEGTWDKGAGTWSTYGGTCTHENLGPAATCTTAQECLECHDPVVSALGHAFNAAHTCTRCNEQATFTVAGSGAHLGTEWDTGNTANDMTYADGVYTKVYTNVSAGTYKFKVARDHDWGTAYPDADKSYTVAKAGSTVTITLKGTTVNVVVEAPHEHSFSDPTCTEPGKCSCNETQGEPTGHKIEGRACANGCGLSLDTLVWWISEGAPYVVEGNNFKYNGAGDSYACVGNDDVVLFAKGHNALTLTITNNGSADSKVRVDLKGQTQVGEHNVINTNAVGGGAWTDLIYGGSMVVVPAGQSVTITVYFDESTDRGALTQLILFVDSATWGDSALYSADVTLSDITFSTHVHEYVEGKCECGEEDSNYVPPHVNALVVGDTNKIVVSGDYVNDYNLPIEWVPFVAEENGFYTFTGSNGALAFIFTPEYGLVSATGAANLEAGNYIICLGNGLVGEFNVAVTKAPWVNALAVGEGNKLLITDALDNGAGYYIVWVPFEVTEKANYTFSGEGILALVYDSAYAAVTGTELEPGTYNICVAFLTPATTGVASVNVTKTPLSDEPVVTPTDPALQIGENTITIDGTITNYIGNAVAWLTFTPEADGTYTFACEELTAYIYAERNMGATALGTGVADLEAGVTYYVLVGKGGVTGEFTLSVSAGGEVVAPNTIVVGENHYVISDALYSIGFEFLELTVTEPGVYKVSGGAPMKVYLFTLPNTDLGTAGAGAFGWNVDALEEDGFADYFYVTLPEAGTYWFGVNYEYVTDEREFDITIELHSEHEYVEGKCECGAQEPVQEPSEPSEPSDPSDEPTTPAPELTLWDKIVAFLKRILAMILGFFKK